MPNLWITPLLLGTPHLHAITLTDPILNGCLSLPLKSISETAFISLLSLALPVFKLEACAYLPTPGPL